MRDGYYDKSCRRWGCIGLVALYMLITAVAVCAIAALSGCTSTRYVPTVRTEWRDREVTRATADTVNNTRVIFVKGDTVIDYLEKERIRNVEIHDTCYVSRVDSVPYPVERRLSRWEQAKIDYGGAAIGVVLSLLCVAVAWLLKCFRK